MTRSYRATKANRPDTSGCREGGEHVWRINGGSHLCQKCACYGRPEGPVNYEGRWSATLEQDPAQRRSDEESRARGAARGAEWLANRLPGESPTAYFKRKSQGGDLT